jgi:hypothetical protein
MKGEGVPNFTLLMKPLTFLLMEDTSYYRILNLGHECSKTPIIKTSYLDISPIHPERGGETLLR